MSLGALRRFAGMQEMLDCLARPIRNKALLCDLCLVSKSFNAAISPTLYSEMRIDGAVLAIILRNGGAFLGNPHLRYMRSLVCCVTGTSLVDRQSSHGDLVILYNEFIIQLLQKIPKLTAFAWSHQPLYTETLSILHKYCPKLVSLTIELPDQIEEQLGIAIESDWDQGNGLWELRPLFSATQDIPAFTNLQVLKFNNIYGDIVSQRSRLVTILLASPDLVELSLSVNADAMFRLNKTGRYDDYYYFLEDLCSLYAAWGGKPLRLRSLFLGLCIYPWERHNLAIPPSLPREDLETYLNNLPKNPPATCVYKLTDLCTLQELSIHNGGHIYVLDSSDGSGIAWCTFTSSSCPELKSISIYLLTEETNNWLASELQHFTQLRIETSDDGYYPLFDLLNSGAGMPSTALPNSVASVASRPSVLVYEECLDLDDAEWFFPLLRVCNYLKGLKINLGSSYISSRSSADSGHSVQFFDAVKDLINLEELYIYSWKELSMDDDWWEELCTQVAYDTANAGLKLRYLKVGSTAWRVWRSEGQVRLETLDKYEQGNVQLFRSYFKY